MSARQPFPATERAPGPRRVALVLAVGAIVSLIVEWPGTYVYDSLLQLLEGRSGRYDFWHPPVMSWLLGLSDRLTPGATAFVAVQTAVGFAGLTVLAALPRRGTRGAFVLAGLICALPQLLMYQGYVLKDVLFADAVLAGFAGLGAATVWPRPAVRLAGLAAAVLFLLLAGLTRQNGLILLPFAGAAFGLAVASRRGARRGVMAGVLLIVLVAAGWMAANAAFARFGDGRRAQESQFKILRAYDLAGMLTRRPDLSLTVLDRQAPALAASLRAQGRALYTPAYNDPLAANEPFSAALEGTDAAVLNRQWRAAIRAAPEAWLAHRAAVFAWLFWPSHAMACHPFYVGVRGPADALRRLGMHERNDARDKALLAYGMAMRPAYAHAGFAVIAALVLGLCLYRRRPEDFVVAGLLGGSLAFAASFFVIAIACDYRYLYLLDLSALAAALYWVADPAPASRRPETPPAG